MGPNVSAPASFGRPVTASDSTDLPEGTCRTVSCTTAGVARVIWANGVDSGAANVNLFVGYNPIAVRRIYATGLTAAGLMAYY